MKRFALLFVVLTTCACGGGARGTAPSSCAATGQCAPGTAPQPHLRRTGGNLLSNPSLSGTAGWSLESGAVYDGSMSRTAGSGSVRLTAPYLEALVSELVPVDPHRTYVFSAFVRTDAWPNLADLAGLRAALRTTIEAGLNGSILMYFFDNETYQAPFADSTRPTEFVDTACAVMDAVAETERELNGGKRLWPRYMLTGNEGMARMYGGCVDLVGDYIIGSEIGLKDVDTSGLVVLDNIEGQRHPRLAQINAPQTAASFRVAIYSMLIAGARGFSYWSDVAPGEDPPAEGVVPIEQTDWYAELPGLQAEIAQALPVLRRPHWTSWRAAASGGATSIGTRDDQGEGYLVVVHDSDAAEAVAFTVSGLPYTPVAVQDYFTGAQTPASSTFTLTLAPHATGIYRLRAPGAVR